MRTRIFFRQFMRVNLVFTDESMVVDLLGM